MAGREVVFLAHRSLRQLLRLHGCRVPLAPCMAAESQAVSAPAEAVRYISTTTTWLRTDGSKVQEPTIRGLTTGSEFCWELRVQGGGVGVHQSPGARFFAGGVSADSNVIVVKTDEEYQKELATSSSITQEEGGTPLIVVTQFTAEWCGPCRMIAPYLDKISKRLEHVKILQVDIDEPNLSRTVQQAEVAAVPTFQFHKKGKVVSVLQGADPQELVKRLTDLSAA